MHRVPWSLVFLLLVTSVMYVLSMIALIDGGDVTHAITAGASLISFVLLYRLTLDK